MLNNDGLDYVPTNKHILFGHHFAAIAGAGPLVGPVLAAQMGYLPGTLWLIAGVVLAGAVQDFMVLFMSTRRNGRSLGDMVREEMGRIPGTIALFGCFLIMIIILAVLALIVVKALAESPWGIFTVMATIPIAMFMGIYMRYIRPGRIGEISVIGVLLLLGSIWLGGQIAADPVWAKAFTFTGVQITWMLIGYGFVAAVLPVWLILAPRDYLSTFLKIGTIVALAIGILVTMPELKMPALTQFIDGTGPVWKGGLFPFLFITIACGAVSGFHALIASGTTPKLLANEGQCPLHRLRRHADGVLRRHHGHGGRFGDRAGRVLRHEQPGGRSSAVTWWLWRKPSAAGALRSPRKRCKRWPRTSVKPPSWPVPAVRRPWRSVSRRSCTVSCRVKTPWRSGTTSRSCSKRCSS